MPHHSTRIESPEQFHLYFLGTFRLKRNDQTIRLSMHKVESLFAFLALYPEPHPREKLASLFWGDVTDEQARLSLRVALSTLRKELDDNLLLADRETIQLNPACPIWLDAHEFQKSVKDDPEPAVELYGGDLLPDLYDDWVTLERERLRSIYVDAMLRLVQQARSESKYACAIELARRVLVTDRANEKAHQHLIFCSLAMGNRTTALKQYEECQRALREEMDVEPSPETTALYTRAQAEASSAKSREALFTNLPTPLTSFVGRVDEIAQVKQLLATTRLLTLVGAGGCGKTRLVIQVATELATADRFEHGVWWVDLASLSDPELVTQSIAMVFNVSASPAMPLLAVLTNYLRAKELLVILDNCEHLLGACGQLVGILLSACPKLHVMVTSREPLSISSEIAWRVPSLALPDAEHLPLAQLKQYDAIQLFVERAIGVARNWRLAENIAPVAQVCTRLDGIPLAIELAAAQLKNFSVQQIAMRLDDRFNLLTDSHRATIQRHQTLRATMDWSYDLLSDAERALLRRLSVFAGGFSLQAVKEICPDVETKYTLLLPDLLTLLIDKSLVVVEHQDSVVRYRLLETVRQYARDKLIASGEAEQTQIRHRNYFVDWIEQASPHLRQADALQWRDQIDWDYDNLRVALEHAIESDGHIALRIAWALRQFWSWRGLAPEGLAWLNRLLPVSENWGASAPRARTLTLGAFLTRLQWNIPAALQFVDQALQVARIANEPRDLGFALQEAGYIHQFPVPPNCAFAVACLEESRKIFETLGDDTMRAWTDTIQGMAIAGTGDVMRGMALMQASLERCRASSDKLGMLDALGGLGYITLLIGDYPSAARYNGEAVAVGREVRIAIEFLQMLTLFTACVIKLGDYRLGLPRAEEVMRLYHDQGSIPGIVIGLETIGVCFAASKKFEPAVRLFGNVEREREAKRSTPFVVPDFFAPEWTNVRAQMGDAAYEKANVEGRAMSLEQAYEYALENVKAIL